MKDEILAKSGTPERKPITLKQHNGDLLRILNFLKKGFPKTPPQYWRLLETAVVFHDLGKAHPEFQKVLQPNKFSKHSWNSQRHELHSLPFVQALHGYTEREMWLLERIVAGHHKGYEMLLDKFISAYDKGEFQEEFAKIDIADVLELIAQFGQYELGEIRPISPKKMVKAYLDDCTLNRIDNGFELLFLAGAFKHCDHMASGFVEKIEFLETTQHFDFLNQKPKILMGIKKKRQLLRGLLF